MILTKDLRQLWLVDHRFTENYVCINVVSCLIVSLHKPWVHRVGLRKNNLPTKWATQI